MKIKVNYGKLDGVANDPERIIGEYFEGANAFGNRVRVTYQAPIVGEKIKNIILAFSAKGTKIDCTARANFLPILAAVGCYANSDTILTFKAETNEDRKLAEETVSAFNAVGGDLEYDGEAIRIKGKYVLRGGGTFNSEDERILIALMLAGTCADNPVTIETEGKAAETLKEFIKVFVSLGGIAQVL